MTVVELHPRFLAHPRVGVLSDRQFRQLIDDACAFARGEALFGPKVLEEEDLVRYRFTERRQRWNRVALWEKFNGICHLCGEIVPVDAFHVEHVIPLARGGHDSWDNLNIAHPRCNLSKGAKTLEELDGVG